MAEKILIVDFGSQVTQLIGRRLRELNVYCEIIPFNRFDGGAVGSGVKGLIMSGSPCSVRDENAPEIDLDGFRGQIPILGICYGAQYLAHKYGGAVNASASREYGRAMLHVEGSSPLTEGLSADSQVWMSHGDTITALPTGGRVIASTADVVNAAFSIDGEATYAVQFHPEVYHTVEGTKILRNFAYRICGCTGDWTPASFIDITVEALRAQIGGDKVILGLSGGVDSTVAAVLLNRAIGARLTCIFVNNGLLRKNEFEDVMASYKDMGLNVIGADAGKEFLAALAGVTEPEGKRKIIGRLFVETFEKYARQIEDVRWLAQGTIYPDVIESAAVNGTATVIKSHHNVGGLPEKMNLRVVEPIRMIFKDEVRRVGRALGIRDELLDRHPFPGPSLGIRVIGEVTEEKLAILREADDIFIRGLRKYSLEGNRAAIAALAGAEAEFVRSASDPSVPARTLYDACWQALAVLLPVQSVGVMGDERTYERTVALRAVISTDGMTADWVRLPYDFLADISNEIINRVRGINRVVYDISSKPPATIEWE
ncbi:MAG: glutamine-hydrolyzing GMP synthase [Bacteroidales bacterium]|nr:glutamine-hydrolyzing GMP synthase [Bacteroidales bacterium]